MRGGGCIWNVESVSGCIWKSTVNFGSGNADPGVSAHSGAQSFPNPHLVDAGLGVQEKQLDGGIVLQVGDAFNVEPEREREKGETRGN